MHQRFMIKTRTMALLIVSVILAACTPSTSGGLQTSRVEVASSFLTAPGELSPVPLSEGKKLSVIATTSILADVVRQVGGEAVEITALIPVDTDPHAYEPVPADVQRMAQAHVIFINGLGLEEFIGYLFESNDRQTPIVSLSEGIEPFEATEEHIEAEEEGGTEPKDHGGVDPHVWFDPMNVITWINNAEIALTSIDPNNATRYHENALSYKAQLEELDSWIEDQVSQIPETARLLVTDHSVLSYFAHRYHFENVGALVPGFSSAAEPSAQQLAQLQDEISKLGVKAIFVGVAVNPNLAERVAADTGIRIVRLYTGALSAADGPAGNYLEFMRYNVRAIVDGLSE